MSYLAHSSARFLSLRFDTRKAIGNVPLGTGTVVAPSDSEQEDNMPPKPESPSHKAKKGEEEDSWQTNRQRARKQEMDLGSVARENKDLSPDGLQNTQPE